MLSIKKHVDHENQMSYRRERVQFHLVLPYCQFVIVYDDLGALV